MSGDEAAGVAFPLSADGHRSTSALGRAVVADALRRADPAGALAASREGNWRTGYLAHFRRLIEAGLTSRQAAVSVARDGLASLHQRMRVSGRDGPETGLGALVSAPARHVLTAVPVAGRGTAEGELAVPYRGERLSGSALLRQLDTWVTVGVIEPSCAEAIRAVAACPDWLALPGRTVVTLGAGAEVGPLPVLLGWGARVIGVDLPRPAIWERVLETARRSGGTLLVPVSLDKPGGGPASEDDQELARCAGLDLVDDVPAVADWLVGVDGPLVLGNYVYADGAANVLVSCAVDALTVRLLAERRDVALGFLSTPTDVFAVPAEAVAYSARAYGTSSLAAKLGRWSLHTVSGGRLLRPGYPPGADPGVCDALVKQQGPNYTLAKRLQRWRATVARDGGTTVSMNVAPPTRTQSVTKNRVLAAAYAGAPRFGLEVFEPATTKTLMAALLVHDLYTGGGPAQAHPWQDEAHAAAHGGMWRVPYAPRSALGLAALLGYRAAGKQGGLPDQREAVVRVLGAARGGQDPEKVISPAVHVPRPGTGTGVRQETTSMSHRCCPNDHDVPSMSYGRARRVHRCHRSPASRGPAVPLRASGRDGQRQAELRRGVGPPRAHREPGGGQLGGHALPAELGRHLGPHLLAVGEVDGEPDGRQVHRLGHARAQPHLDPLSIGIPYRDVLERVQVEVRAEFGVQHGQHVPVELGGDS
jgi:hypothetical protein